MLRGAALLILFGAAPALAAEPPAPLQAAIGNPDWLHVSGTLRTRVETIAEGLRPGFLTDETLVMTRATLMLDIGNGPVHLVTELWDSRAFGIVPGSIASTGEVNTLEPVQALLAVDLGTPFGKDSRAALKFGRMVLNLGSRRLIAADDYRNTTNGYTGVRIDVTPLKDVNATFIYTLPQQRLPNSFADVRSKNFELDRESFDTVLWGGIAEWRHAIGKTSLEASGFQLTEHDSPGHPTRDRDLSTIDLRLHSDHGRGKVDHEVEGAWQWGRSRQALSNALPARAVEAWYVHADLGYTFDTGWAPRLSAEFDAISGDRPGGKYTRFDTLYGMRRADFSPGSLLSYIGRANMVAPALRLEIAPSPRTDGFVSARALWAESGTDSFSQTGVRDPTGRSGRFAGYEFDSRVRQWLVAKRLRAEANSVLYLRRGLLREAPNVPRGELSYYFSAALIGYF